MECDRYVMPTVKKETPVETTAETPSESPETVTTFEIDPKTGRYAEVKRPKAEIEAIAEWQDRYQADQLGIEADWQKRDGNGIARGRGQHFHARWVNANPQHRMAEVMQGYAPVRPEDVPPEIRRRYLTTEVEGITGKCLVAGDLYLAEIPHDRRNRRKEGDEDRYLASMDEMVNGVSEKANEKFRSAGVPIETASRLMGAIGNPLEDNRTAKEVLYGEDGGYGDTLAEADATAFEKRERTSVSFAGFEGSARFNKTNWKGPKPNYGYEPATIG